MMSGFVLAKLQQFIVVFKICDYFIFNQVTLLMHNFSGSFIIFTGLVHNDLHLQMPCCN